jgi:hypothetical protein
MAKPHIKPMGMGMAGVVNDGDDRDGPNAEGEECSAEENYCVTVKCGGNFSYLRVIYLFPDFDRYKKRLYIFWG